MSLSENQRGELLLTDVAHQITAGGGKPGQGYQAVLISSQAGSPAKTSPLPDSDEGSPATGPASSTSLPESLTLFDPDLSSSRTYPDCSPAMAVGTSESCLERWPTSGTAWRGGFSTAVSSECRSDADGCSSSEPSLTEILEPPQNVPDKYSLSARAANGILVRARKRGRSLPAHLEAALETVAGMTETRSTGGGLSLSGMGSGGPDDNDAQAGLLIVADTLSSGGHPNSNAPGRRREDDHNLVPVSPAAAATLKSHNGKGGSGISPEDTFLVTDGRIGRPENDRDERFGVGGLELASLGERGVGVCGGLDFTAVETHAVDEVGHGVDHTKPAAAVKASPDETLVAVETLIAGPLGGGNNGAGRRSEDDPNLVTSFDWQVAGSERTWIHNPPGGPSRSISASKSLAVQGHDVGVRRLTPTEYERLQAWPDGWTQLGGTKDGPRYSACGDGVTASVSLWIGERLGRHLVHHTERHGPASREAASATEGTVV